MLLTKEVKESCSGAKLGAVRSRSGVEHDGEGTVCHCCTLHSHNCSPCSCSLEIYTLQLRS